MCFICSKCSNLQLTLLISSSNLLYSIQSLALPVLFTRELESMEAMEEGSITLHCELSKSGAPVEWRKGSQLLKSGEKYHMTQNGCSHALQILDLKHIDTGNYACSSGDAESFASLKVNGRTWAPFNHSKTNGTSCFPYHPVFHYPSTTSFMSSHLHPSSLCCCVSTIKGALEKCLSLINLLSFVSPPGRFHPRA